MPSYQHIVVAVDESAIALEAAKQALALASTLQARVTLMSVIAVDPFVGVDFYKVAPAITDYFLHAEQSAQRRLNELAADFLEVGLDAQTKIIRGVSPDVGILQIADEVNADLIMMGSHGRSGLQKFLLGSVAQKVLHQSPIAVLIARH